MQNLKAEAGEQKAYWREDSVPMAMWGTEKQERGVTGDP